MDGYMDLYVLQERIRESLEASFPDSVWVMAEVASVSVKANGHCYLELSRSGPQGITAKCRAVIWRSRYQLLNRMFAAATGSPLSAGMNVLAHAKVSYHEIYGMSLNIDDINPDFTLGERERLRRETVERLRAEGLLDLQKELALPVVPYRLAVVSAENAAGYGDFRRHLLENEYGFAYMVDLFPAQMQGAGAPESVADALQAVAGSLPRHDAVLIIRGGGSELDLACFDDYSLAAAIARCPLPVFTAIGHDRDSHVADMVANTSVKTPTALADLFLDGTAAEDARISSYGTRISLAFSNRAGAMESGLESMNLRIRHSALMRVERAESALGMLETKLSATDPRNVLKRGFSLVLDSSGVRMTSAAGRRAGDGISVLMPDGRLDCRVEDVRTIEK